MLLLFTKYNEIDVTQLLNIWSESIHSSGIEKYPNHSIYEQRILSERDCSDYLQDMLNQSTGICAVWAPTGRYAAALRLEQYRDGFLIAGLETALDARRKGYAEALLSSLLDHFIGTPIYSHISIKNVPSIRLHEKCGFRRIFDHAVFLDGSVSTNAYTYLSDSKKTTR